MTSTNAHLGLPRCLALRPPWHTCGTTYVESKPRTPRGLPARREAVASPPVGQAPRNTTPERSWEVAPGSWRPSQHMQPTGRESTSRALPSNVRPVAVGLTSASCPRCAANWSRWRQVGSNAFKCTLHLASPPPASALELSKTF